MNIKKQLLTMAVAVGFLFSGFHSNVSANGDLYTVRIGDTLWGIAKTNGLTLTELKSLNGLISDVIYPGQQLIVAGSPLTSSSAATYTVQSGDSLWKIATYHNLSISELKTYNQLTTDIIYVGQVLMLPVTGTIPQSMDNTVSKRAALVAEAKKYIGVPYKWGGSTPAGFDCSGFVNYVYTNVGVSIPRTVTSIWDATKAVSAPAIGDLVFFNTSGNGLSHIGIYLGNNEFIHAGYSTGVTITSLNLSYWKSIYLGARTAF